MTREKRRHIHHLIATTVGWSGPAVQKRTVGLDRVCRRIQGRQRLFFPADRRHESNIDRACSPIFASYLEAQHGNLSDGGPAV